MPARTTVATSVPVEGTREVIVAGARVSFLVLAGRATVVVDVPGDGHSGALTAEDDPVVWSFTGQGLRLLPGYRGQQVPVTPRLRCAVGHGRLAISTRDEIDVVDVDLDELPDTWLEAAERHDGVLLFVGRDLDVDVAANAVDVADALDAAARQARLLGAAVDLV